MDASQIIQAFGGPAKVAERFGANRTAVYNWRHTGIPARFWLTMVEAAKADGIAGITPDSVAWRPSAPRAEPLLNPAPTRSDPADCGAVANDMQRRQRQGSAPTMAPVRGEVVT